MPNTTIAETNVIKAAGINSAAILATVAAMAILSKVAIPFYPVPLTLQTFGVLASGLLLGSRRAIAAQLLYLLCGLSGLPVFALPAAGPAILFGPTGGYLLAFVAAAGIAGLANDPNYSPIKRFAILALATGLILTVGTIWLGVSMRMSLPAALIAGFIPFIPGELLKTATLSLRIALPEKSNR